MTDRLPEKVISIEQVKINRSRDKICKCSNRRFEIDTRNRKIHCRDCGAMIAPYDAMYDLAMKGNRLQGEVNQLLEQRKQIINYKPWLVTIKKLERQYRGKKMLPCCPRCDEPFYLEELTSWTGKPFADGNQSLMMILFITL
ncbi:hypothetical protein SAMN04487943_11233 [Gracilibacillus orientalis]|uniref:Uncharacterized protein n=1 Tax=Gracilibacillus orientalis TaxID=334253 RepID=A0A1I4PLQ3_9BACI|nr:hypothetical protein [Gracilibacillus orientalis]SFM28749.1 hypothetical protein SAMN04487943_11233 [Gracilibacillus orientalis]